jgi:hypothetical protein
LWIGSGAAEAMPCSDYGENRTSYSLHEFSNAGGESFAKN